MVLTVFQLLLLYVAPVVVLPLFNRFAPLPEGALKDKLSAYAEKQGFRLKGLFTMDGSRRSTRANAYFTGFGRWRRIVLYDTLVEQQEPNELTSVFAHEVGHYKLRHIQRQLAVSVLSTGLMLYILSLFVTRPGLYEAFGVSTETVGGYPPLYAGMVFFGFLYAPIGMALSLWHNYCSRQNEFEADAFAVRTYGQPEAMIAALKKLTVDNLVNLTPHPAKVFVGYSHPPVLRRILAIRRQMAPGEEGGEQERGACEASHLGMGA